jgi:N-acetylneuraminate lyase
VAEPFDSTAHLTGLIAAPPTPMRDDGEVDLAKIDALVGLLCDNGVGGAFVCGNTGEGISLSVSERMAVAQRWAEAAAGRLEVVIQVGANAVADARALARHAAQIGARAVASFAPSFYRPADAETLADFLAQIAGACPLPFYFYHLPARTGVEVRVHDLLVAARGRIPTMAGAKFTHADLMDFLRCVRLEGGRYNMLFGRDEFLLCGLALGARGAVGSTYNFAAPLYRRLLEAFEAGDLAAAQAAQARAAEMVAAIMRCGAGPPAFKAVMGLIGLDVGPPRTPQRRLSGRRIDALRADLDAVGFFDYCCRTG